MYEREDGTRIGMWHASDRWFIGDLDSVGEERGFASLESSAFGPELAEDDVCWTVFDGGATWVHQRSVAAVPVGAPGVLICGALESQGKHRRVVNGVFMRTDTVVNGCAVYMNEGSENLMWHTDGSWWIGQPKSVGEARGFGYIKSHGAAGPDLAAFDADWQLLDHASSDWNPHSSIATVPVGAQSVLVCGARGSNAIYINGVYHRCQQDDHIVYEKEDHEYMMVHHNGQWMIGSTEDVPERSYAELDSCQPSPDLAAADWQVWSGEAWIEQTDVVTVPVGAPTVILAGATGPNADAINGSFSRTNVAINRHAVYQKDGSIGMWFSAFEWIIGRPSDTGSIIGWATLASSAPSPDLKPDDAHWCVHGEAKWARQKRITTTGSGTKYILFSGAERHNTSVNGVFRRDDEMVVSGRPVYQREGKPSVSLWYHGDGKTWWVGQTESIGTNRGYAQLDSEAAGPELARGAWEEYDGADWVSKPCFVALAVGAPSVIISGITGRNAGRINGAFFRTETAINERAMYEKDGDASMGMWFSSTKWWIGALDKVGESEGHANLMSHAAGPELAADQTHWSIWDGSVWQPQPQVCVLAVDDVAVGAGSQVRQRARTFGGRTFASSNFKHIYEKTKVPAGPMQMGAALNGLVKSYCQQTDIPWDNDEGQRFFEHLEQEAMQNAQELTTALPQAAQRMWTSAKTLRSKEFCAILNHALRDDAPELIEYSAVLVRAINQLCVTSGNVTAVHPPDLVCFRGGGFDEQCRDFFVAGVQFRQPAYVATSFSRDVARRFIARAAGARVLWLIKIDRHRKCAHVNLVHKSNVPGEQEYLFAPYSAFTALSAKWNAGTAADPHVIELLAAVDNTHAPEDLPLAPCS